jgi:hypothetical protein
LIVIVHRILLIGVFMAASGLAFPASAGETPGEVAAAEDLEAVKQDLMTLKRDLVILEEDLLFPASSQVAVFLSMDVGEFFQLDAVTVKLDGDQVTHHLYTERQVDALLRGGVQRLFLGNVQQGSHRLTAFFTGRGPSERDYRRAATVEFEKTFEPTFIELAIRDSESNYQPEFTAAVSKSGL